MEAYVKQEMGILTIRVYRTLASPFKYEISRKHGRKAHKMEYVIFNLPSLHA